MLQKTIQRTTAPATHVAQHARRNVGVRTDDLAVIDIDIYEPDVAARVTEAVEARFGIAPKRIGQAPKVALVYLAKEPGRKITSPTWVDPDDPAGRAQRVEVLGQGNQFIAFGIHPGTKEPYRWVGESLTDRATWDLPVMDRNEFAAWLRDEFPKLMRPDWNRDGDGSGGAGAADTGDLLVTYQPPHDDVDLAAFEWMLNELPPGVDCAGQGMERQEGEARAGGLCRCRRCGRLSQTHQGVSARPRRRPAGRAQCLAECDQSADRRRQGTGASHS